LTFEIRYTSIDERDRVLKEIDTIVKTSYVKGSNAKLRGGIQRDVMEETQQSRDLVKNIEHIAEITLPTEKRGGVSDANIVASCSVVTLDGFGPFGDGDHTIHERALKESFESRIELSTKLFIHFIQKGDFVL